MALLPQAVCCCGAQVVSEARPAVQPTSSHTTPAGPPSTLPATQARPCHGSPSNPTVPAPTTVFLPAAASQPYGSSSLPTHICTPPRNDTDCGAATSSPDSVAVSSNPPHGAASGGGPACGAATSAPDALYPVGLTTYTQVRCMPLYALHGCILHALLFLQNSIASCCHHLALQRLSPHLSCTHYKVRIASLCTGSHTACLVHLVKLL